MMATAVNSIGRPMTFVGQQLVEIFWALPASFCLRRRPSSSRLRCLSEE